MMTGKFNTGICILSIALLLQSCKQDNDTLPPPAATAPQITHFTPTTGVAGTLVTITGTGFSNDKNLLTLQFNGIAAHIDNSTTTSITTSVPAGATTGLITVTVNGKTATSTTVFTVTPGGGNPAWAIGWLAGDGDNASDDGPALTASFRGPKGLVTDAAGNVYVADALANKIRKITPQGNVITVAGTGAPGNSNGDALTQATFRAPTGLALGPNGELYVADQGNHMIRKISPAGIVTTHAGTGIAGKNNGPAKDATFNMPYGIVCNNLGTLFISDFANHIIRKISHSGQVFTIAGNGSSTSSNGYGTSAGIPWPGGITLDEDHNIYVTEKGAGRIRKIAGTSEVTTIGGHLSVNTEPTGIAVDEEQNVYVLFRGLHKIKKYTPNGIESNFIGTGDPGSADGILGSFQHPEGLAFRKDAQGKVIFYVGDTDNKKIRKVTFQ